MKKWILIILMIPIIIGIASAGYCGDGLCESGEGENTTSCCSDCGCSGTCTYNLTDWTDSGFDQPQIYHSCDTAGAPSCYSFWNTTNVTSIIPLHAYDVQLRLNDGFFEIDTTSSGTYNRDHQFQVFLVNGTGMTPDEVIVDITNEIEKMPSECTTGCVFSTYISPTFNVYYGYEYYLDTEVGIGAGSSSGSWSWDVYFDDGVGSTDVDIKYKQDYCEAGTGASNLDYSCAPDGAGSNCTDQINVGQEDYTVSTLEVSGEIVDNPLTAYFENVNDFRVLTPLDNLPTNVIGSTDYEISTECLEEDKCISITKNQVGTTLSFEKTVGKSVEDSNGDFMFSHFYMDIPSSIKPYISTIRLYLGDSDLSDYYRIDMKSTGLSVGWNLITEKWGQFQANRFYETIGSPDTANIEKMRIEVTFTQSNTYTDEILFDYIFSQKYKQEKSGTEYFHYIVFDSSGIHNMNLTMSAFGTDYSALIPFNVSTATTTILNWTAGFAPTGTYDASLGDQTLCLNYTDTSFNKIVGADCYVTTLHYDTNIALTFVATELTDDYCADVTYFVNGNHRIQGICQNAVGFEENNTAFSNTTVSNADFEDTFATINVYSYNYKYYSDDYFQSDYEACYWITDLNVLRCCILNSYNGQCSISIEAPWQFDPIYSSMLITQEGILFEPRIHINLLSVKNGEYSQDIYIVDDIFNNLVGFSLVNQTGDCNLTNFSGVNYNNITLPPNRTIELYECTSTTCSERYNLGYARSITNNPAEKNLAWFWIEDNAWENLIVLNKHNILCDGSDITTTYCTPAERFNSPIEMLNTITPSYSAFPRVVGLVQIAYEGLTGSGWNGVPDDNIILMGSVVRCQGNCGLYVEPCYGTCTEDNQCKPYTQERNMVQKLFGYFTDNEGNFPIIWLIISLGVAVLSGIYATNQAGVVSAIAFLGMLMLGGSIGVLPIWISVTLVVFVILVIAIILFIQAIKGGGE